MRAVSEVHYMMLYLSYFWLVKIILLHYLHLGQCYYHLSSKP